MKVIQLMIVLIVLMIVLFAIYFLIQLLLDEKKSSVVRSIVENRFKDKPEGEVDKEEIISKIENGDVKASKYDEIKKSEIEEISKSLHEEIRKDGEEVAFIFCRGGSRVLSRFNYQGVQGCKYMNKLYSGNKICSFACLGCMDCAKVCPTKAIFKNEFGIAEVDRSLCTGCGLCAKECPNKLIKMIPLEQKMVTACKYCLTDQRDKDINNFCAVGCSKCKRCVKICKTGALSLNDKGEIVFNNAKCTRCYKCVRICPSGTISPIIDAVDKI